MVVDKCKIAKVITLAACSFFFLKILKVFIDI